MADSRDHYIDSNRAAWDEAAPHHRAAESFQDLLKGFASPGFSCFDPVAHDVLRHLQLAGKAVAQLCCNNGRELLSVKNLGAGRCVGFDQSSGFLEQARELAAAAKIDCRFVHGDVHRIPEEFNRAFDLVLVTIGVFGWMPDLRAFLKVAARLLRGGGALFVYEQHPIMNMFEPTDGVDPHRLANSYFRREPFVENNIIVYEGAAGQTGSTHYWFVHTLADVLSSCIDSGLRIEHFREYAHNISSEEFDVYDGRHAQLPQGYTLIARKDG